MKKLFLLSVVLMVSIKMMAQGMYNFELGAGSVASYGSYTTPTVGASCYKMLIPHFYLGGMMNCRYYSFQYNDPSLSYNDPNYGNISSINHHSTYLFVSPAINVSVGRNQYFHFNFNIGPGLYLHGSETTNYVTNPAAGYFLYNSINTSADNNWLVYQYGMGFSVVIPTNWHWSLEISQHYSILGRNLNSYQGNGPGLKTDYYSFTIGLAHFYNKLYY